MPIFFGRPPNKKQDPEQLVLEFRAPVRRSGGTSICSNKKERKSIAKQPTQLNRVAPSRKYGGPMVVKDKQLKLSIVEQEDEEDYEDVELPRFKTDLLDYVFGPLENALTGNAVRNGLQEIETQHQSCDADEVEKQRDDDEREWKEKKQQQKRKVIVKALDADEEAARIMAIPRSEWTESDKKIMEGLVVDKLREDYEKLGMQVESLSEYALNEDSNNSLDDGSYSATSSSCYDAYDSHSTYYSLRKGMGSILHSSKRVPSPPPPRASEVYYRHRDDHRYDDDGWSLEEERLDQVEYRS